MVVPLGAPSAPSRPKGDPGNDLRRRPPLSIPPHHKQHAGNSLQHTDQNARMRLALEAREDEERLPARQKNGEKAKKERWPRLIAEHQQREGLVDT